MRLSDLALILEGIDLAGVRRRPPCRHRQVTQGDCWALAITRGWGVPPPNAFL